MRSNSLIQVSLTYNTGPSRRMKHRNHILKICKWSRYKGTCNLGSIHASPCVRGYQIPVFLVNFWALKPMAGHLKALMRLLVGTIMVLIKACMVIPHLLFLPSSLLLKWNPLSWIFSRRKVKMRSSELGIVHTHDEFEDQWYTIAWVPQACVMSKCRHLRENNLKHKHT